MIAVEGTQLARRLLAGLLVATIASLIGLWLFFFFAALGGFPLLSGDHSYFTPVIRSVRDSGLLVQPFVLHSTGHKFNWHGWLYPTVMAFLPWTDSYRSIGAAFLLLVAVSTIGFAALLLRRGPGIGAILLIPVMFAALLFQMPRMELAASPLLLAMAPLLARQPDRLWQWSLLVVLISAVALIQPTLGVYLMGVLVLQLARWSRSFTSLGIRAAAAGTGTLLVTALATELHPQLSFLEWVKALRTQAGLLLERSDGSLVHYLLTDASLFGRLIYFLALPLLGLYALRPVGGSWQWRYQRATLLVMLLGAAAFLWLTAVRLPGTNYNLVGLAPLLWLAVHRTTTEPWAGRRWGQALVAIAFALAGATIGFRVMATAHSLASPSDRAKLARIVRPLRDFSGTIGASPGIALHVSELLPGKELSYWPNADLVSRRVVRAEPRPDLLIVQQSDSSLLEPAPIAGYRLVFNGFSPHPVRLGGAVVLRTRKDYAVAVYCRLETCPRVRRAFHPGANGWHGVARASNFRRIAPDGSKRLGDRAFRSLQPDWDAARDG